MKKTIGKWTVKLVEYPNAGGKICLKLGKYDEEVNYMYSANAKNAYKKLNSQKSIIDLIQRNN